MWGLINEEEDERTRSGGASGQRIRPRSSLTPTQRMVQRDKRGTRVKHVRQGKVSRYANKRVLEIVGFVPTRL